MYKPAEAVYIAAASVSAVCKQAEFQYTVAENIQAVSAAAAEPEYIEADCIAEVL